MKLIAPRDGVIHSFSAGTSSVATVELGEVVTVETLDALNGTATAESGSTKDLDMNLTNPATGPLFLEGVSPGDMIGVEILAIDVAPEGVGLSSSRYRRIRIAGGRVAFSTALTIPTRPHIGVIGVIPREGSYSCKLPGDHGGNLDTKEIRAGSTFAVPVQVEGGLLALGDVHAVMADGEVNGAGLEVSARVTLRVTRIASPLLRSLHVITEDYVIVLASGDRFEEASRFAIQRTVGLLQETNQMAGADALLLAGYACDCASARSSTHSSPPR